MSANGKRFKATAILVALFLLGGAAGAAVMRTVMLGEYRQTFGGPPGQSRAQFRLRAMERHLDLSDEQRTKIESILAETGDKKDEAMEPCRAGMDQLRTATETRIDEVLTPEQRAKHQEMRERFSRNRRGKR